MSKLQKAGLLGIAGVPLLSVVAAMGLIAIGLNETNVRVVLSLLVLAATSIGLTISVTFLKKRGGPLGLVGILAVASAAILHFAAAWDRSPLLNPTYTQFMISLLLVVGVYTHVLLVHIPALPGRYCWAQHGILLFDTLFLAFSLIAIWADVSRSGLHLGMQISGWGAIGLTLLLPVCMLIQFRQPDLSPKPH